MGISTSISNEIINIIMEDPKQFSIRAYHEVEKKIKNHNQNEFNNKNNQILL
jgi:hypothetical protein